MERKVLNVGGNDKAIKIPSCYAHWTHHLLDIESRPRRLIRQSPDLAGDDQEAGAELVRRYAGRFDRLSPTLLGSADPQVAARVLAAARNAGA